MSGVDASGVVGAGVQDDYSVFRGIFQVLEHSLEIQTTSLWLPVAVSLGLSESGIGENQIMVLYGLFT